jgi:hypothetical protein
MRGITERIQLISKAHEAIGKVTCSNCFPTLKGRLLYIKDEKCYFEMLENDEYLKYNECAGQIVYLPEYMVVCMNFIEN